jgi:multidrug transporter EmrE-like cation transporter
VRIKRQSNLGLGLLAVVLAGVALATSLNAIPASMADWLWRGAPAVLVLIGLAVWLRYRAPFSAVLALVATVILVSGVALFAYNTRATQPRDQQQLPIDQPLDADVTLLRVALLTLDTDLRIEPTTERAIRGQYIGSNASTIVIDFTSGSNGDANFSLQETRNTQLPSLADVGRGQLLLQIPVGIAVDVGYRGGQGAAEFSLSGVSLERLNIAQGVGDVLVTLPLYDPIGTAGDGSLGTWQTGNGRVTVVVPREMGASFTLDRRGSGLLPLYDDTIFTYLGTRDVVESRTLPDAEQIIRYAIVAPIVEVRTLGGN